MVAATAEATPSFPDFLTDPNAVLQDSAPWRYGKAPDYLQQHSGSMGAKLDLSLHLPRIQKI